MSGNRIPLNLGPRHIGSGRRLPLNLGVPWDAEVVEPPEEPLRGLWAGSRIAWKHADLQAAQFRVLWGAAPRVSVQPQTRWSAAAAIGADLRLRWGALGRLQRSWALRQQSADRLFHDDAFGWGDLPRVQRTGSDAWRNTARISQGASLRWQTGGQQERMLSGRWHGVLAQRGHVAASTWRTGPSVARGARLPWGNGALAPWIVKPPVVVPPEPPRRRVRGNRIGLNLGCPRVNLGGNIPLNLGVTACYAVRPSRRVYIVINTIDVVRLPDRSPIAVESVEISGGIGAFGYDLQMTLADPSHLALLRMTESGPAEVEVAMNGYLWTFLIESHSRQRAWSDDQGLVRTVTLSGRSRTAVLASPYAPARTTVSGFDRTAQQLIDEELEDTGYTADYDALNWVVPAGAWFYEATTPMDAIARVASASGAVVLSDPADKAIRIVPRYPVSPWDWTSTAPDLEFVDDVILSEAVNVRSVPKYDAVVVAGELAGKGVLVRVVRTGEAGTVYAQQATDPLINTVAVATERGRNILSDRGEQEQIDLTVPLFPIASLVGPHRVLPLNLVQVLDAAGAWIGLATAVRISGRRENDAVIIDQSISLERHYTDAN